MSFNLDVVPPVRRHQLSVIAGHFQWGVWDTRGRPQTASDSLAPVSELARPHAPARPPVRAHTHEREHEHEREYERALDPTPLGAACFVMLREPVERTISYYYERVYPSEWAGKVSQAACALLLGSV